MIIGEAIKHLRKNKSGLNQKEFCKEIGITQSYLSLIEGNKKIPSMDVLNKICNYFNTPLPVLFWFSVNEEDIQDDKKDMYKILKPTIDEMINSVFL